MAVTVQHLLPLLSWRCGHFGDELARFAVCWLWTPPLLPIREGLAVLQVVLLHLLSLVVNLLVPRRLINKWMPETFVGAAGE